MEKTAALRTLVVFTVGQSARRALVLALQMKSIVTFAKAKAQSLTQTLTNTTNQKETKENNMENTEVKSKITIAVNRAFVMGANYQRLKMLEMVYNTPDYAPFVDQFIEIFNLKQEITDADVFTNSNN